MDKSIEQFQSWWEEWFGEAPLTPWNELWCGDGYSAEDIDHMWEAWQASRAAVEIELPPTIEVHPLGPSTAKMFCELHKNTVAECANSIRAAGLKIKGE
nr:hypothetical protein [Cronobacter sakazakii]